MNLELILKEVFAWLADVTLQSTLLLAIAGGIVWLRPRMAAARRHFLLVAALLAIPMLMLGSGLAPVWRPFGKPDPKILVVMPRSSVQKGIPSDPAPIMLAAGLKAMPAPAQRFITPGWHVWACVWLAGIGIGLLSLTRASLHLRRLRRVSVPESDSRLLDLFHEVQTTFRLVLPDSALRRSPDCVVPMTWGWRGRTILLPDDAGDWTDARCRLVLRHELAHIARGDVTVSFLTTVSALLLWFHPLVWVLWHACHATREQACDDLALLHSGSSREDFAEELLAAVTGLGNVCRCILPLALAMAASQRARAMKRRLAGILDETRARQPWCGTQRVAWMGGIVAVAFMLSGLTACREAAKSADTQIMITSKVFSVRMDSPWLAGAGLTLGDDAALKMIGIHDETRTTALVKQLTNANGVTLMSAPSVTTRNKQRATVEVIREFIYPTEFDPPQSTPGKPVTPTTPTAFEMRPVGVRMEFDPVVREDGAIELTLTPEVTSFEGFINYGSPIEGIAASADAKEAKITFTENVINQPIFHTVKTSTSVMLRDGQSVVFGGQSGPGSVPAVTTKVEPRKVADVLLEGQSVVLGGQDVATKVEPQKFADVDAKADELIFFIIQAKIIRR